MNNTTDLSKSFSKLIDSNFVYYKGCLLEIIDGRIKWNKQSFSTEEELNKAIQKAGKQLSNSISK